MGDLGTILASLLILVAATAVKAEPKDPGCVGCHTDTDMEERLRTQAFEFEKGVHARAGLGCTDCHGGLGDSTQFLRAHGKRNGFRGRPTEAEIAALCATCHDDAARMKELGFADAEVGQGREFTKSVHGRIRPVEGFEAPSCISCHGSHGIRGPGDLASPVHPTRVPSTCDRCHGDLDYMRAFTSARVATDQLAAYRTSIHGKELAKGDVKVAVCSSCHGSHEILPATDRASKVHPLAVADTCGACHADPVYMAGYRIPARGGGDRPIPTDQREAYRGSVHADALTEKGDLSAPTCNDCHGNHGATPPEVRTVANVCGQCHSRPAELFEASALQTEIDDGGWPGCATCHGHHRIEHPGLPLLEAIAEGRAMPSGWVPGEEQRRTARTYLERLEAFRGEMESVDARVARAENYGLDLTRARLRLNLAHDRLLTALVQVHAFDLAALGETIDGTEDEEGGLPLVAEADALAEEALGERSFRRVGLVVALGIIGLLIVALILKIRRMEQPELEGHS